MTDAVDNAVEQAQLHPLVVEVLGALDVDVDGELLLKGEAAAWAHDLPRRAEQERDRVGRDLITAALYLERNGPEGRALGVDYLLALCAMVLEDAAVDALRDGERRGWNAGVVERSLLLPMRTPAASSARSRTPRADARRMSSR
jgi:hypothetical protein